MTDDGLWEGAVRPIAAAPTSGALRLVRGGAVGATAMGLAVAGHVAGGAALPTPTTAAVLLAASVAGSVGLSGRRWTASALLAVLLGAQVVFHVAMGSHAGMHQHMSHGLSASMVLAHVVAALLAALLLRRGEVWCWQLVALFSRPAKAARALGTCQVPASPVGLVQPAARPLPALRSQLLAVTQPRRGPPALLAR